MFLFVLSFKSSPGKTFWNCVLVGPWRLSSAVKRTLQKLGAPSREWVRLGADGPWFCPLSTPVISLLFNVFILVVMILFSCGYSVSPPIFFEYPSPPLFFAMSPVGLGMTVDSNLCSELSPWAALCQRVPLINTCAYLESYFGCSLRVYYCDFYVSVSTELIRYEFAFPLRAETKTGFLGLLCYL